MLEEEDYDEIDCSIFTQRSNLDGTCMDDVESALKRFDRSCSNPTNREQLFNAYVTTKKEIRNDLSKLGSSDEYGRAKDVRNTMTRIRHECETLEAAATKANQNSQCTYLDKANRKISTELNRKHQLQAEAMKERNRRIEEEHRMTNKIEWENLNLILSRIPRPRVRYSKRVVQLLDAENGLIKHGQYDDAQRVRHMLDKLIPNEELKFYADFDAGIEVKRERLRTLQSSASLRGQQLLNRVEMMHHLRVRNENTSSGDLTVKDSRIFPAAPTQWCKRDNSRLLTSQITSTLLSSILLRILFIMTSAVYAPTKKGQKPDPCSILSFYVLNFTKSLSANENINSDSRSFCVADYQASMFTSYLRPLSTTCSQDFIAKFDVLLNRFGIDAVLFMQRRRASCELGIVCLLKLHGKRPEELVFGTRSAGEMKRLHFNLADIIKVEVGQKEISDCIPQTFRIQSGEDKTNCFISITTKLKGSVKIMLKSRLMRDACLKGFNLLVERAKLSREE